MHARVGRLARTRASWGKHEYFASGISARVSMAKGRVPDPNCNLEIESESYTLNTILKNVEWGWRGRASCNQESPDPGRGNFLFPRSCGQSSERLISWYLSRSAFCLPAHRHLGTRSPSGNARGGCRGCTLTFNNHQSKNMPPARDNVFVFCFRRFFLEET